MVTGRRAFEGDNVTDTLAAVVTKEPDLDAVPAELRPLLARCLQEDPKQRLRDIAGVESLWELGRAQTAAPGAAMVPHPVWSRRLPWAVAAALAVTSVVAAWGPWRPPHPVSAPPLARLDVELGPGAVAASGISAILSPDGILEQYAASVVADARPSPRRDAELRPRARWNARPRLPTAGDAGAGREAHATFLLNFAEELQRRVTDR